MFRALAALVLAVLMLLGELPGGHGTIPAAAAEGTRWTAGETAEGRPGSGELTAARNKNKKKKNTPTPKPAATPTPEAEADEGNRLTPTPEPEGPITDPQSIADYLFSHDMQLPENFITKKEAQRLGWDSRTNYVSDVAPGKSIGGDYFGNYQGKLPQGKGITYREADCWYTGGRRNACRIIYSNQGRVWYTEDHYETFTELFPTVPRETEDTGGSR